MKKITSAFAAILLIIVIFQFKGILKEKSTIEKVDKIFNHQGSIKNDTRMVVINDVPEKSSEDQQKNLNANELDINDIKSVDEAAISDESFKGFKLEDKSFKNLNSILNYDWNKYIKNNCSLRKNFEDICGPDWMLFFLISKKAIKNFNRLEIIDFSKSIDRRLLNVSTLIEAHGLLNLKRLLMELIKSKSIHELDLIIQDFKASTLKIDGRTKSKIPTEEELQFFAQQQETVLETLRSNLKVIL